MEQDQGADGRENRFALASAERRAAPRFYAHFRDLPGALSGKRVLDFGCGYGGKTVAYADHAAFVAGVEPFEHVIRLCEDYRQHIGAQNVEFRTCAQAEIPYPTGAFDVVVSHDVLEHVDDPAASLDEVLRVLKPGGTAFLVFPPYDGAFSHHLDYVSRMPALHWLFRPASLVGAANRAIKAWDLHGVGAQPAPLRSWDGRRDVLPTLNGLTGVQFEELARRRFAPTEVRYELIGREYRRRNPMAGAVELMLSPLAALGASWRDRCTLSIAAKLSKEP